MIRPRGQVVLILLCLWALAVVLPTVRIAPGPWASLEFSQAKEASSPEAVDSPLSLKTSLLTYGVILGILIFFNWWQAHQRKPPGVAPREHPSLRRPWLAAALLAFVFAFVGSAFWWARHQPAVTEITRPAGQMVVVEEEPTPATQAPASPEIKEAPQPAVPLWVVYLFLTSGLALVGWWVWRVLGRSSELGQLVTGEGPDMVQIATRAVNDLQRGALISDVVLRCYLDMCRILSQKVMMRREMTAREFVESLARVGVRRQEVKRLTGLFEKVRYGHHVAGPKDRAEAIALLEAIGRQYGESCLEA